MNKLVRQTLVLLLVMLQGVAPLLHTHNGLANMGQAGLHLPELSDAGIGEDQGGPSLHQSDPLARTFVLADILRSPHDGALPPPPQLAAYMPVVEVVPALPWVPAPYARSASLRSDYLIPYSCAPPRA